MAEEAQDTNSEELQNVVAAKEVVKFADCPTLGKVVAEKKLVCSLGISKTINFQKRLRFACGFDKLGFLCGFRFTTNKVGVKNKTFLVVFVPKLKSSIMRQQKRGRSSWYIWEYINPTIVNVMSSEKALKTYGFDVDAFFHSDLFKESVPKFLKVVKAGLKNEIDPYIAKADVFESKELKRYVRAIEDSLQTLEDSAKDPDSASSKFNLGSSSDGESKVYRSGRNYELDHFQKRRQDDINAKIAQAVDQVMKDGKKDDASQQDK